MDFFLYNPLFYSSMYLFSVSKSLGKHSGPLTLAFLSPTSEVEPVAFNGIVNYP
jgi:hypothetical protein